MSSLLMKWESYAALRRQDKPAELVYLPNGAHNLVKPHERYVSQQGSVDWFRFWLQDYEDADPTKAEQYGRWREWKRAHTDTSAREGAGQ
ncbi:MAG TPA: hypothetical protein VJ011_10050 [Steroidobacteraceae bacterium]|nr:hypothetical protein [Steroidobacteraceae bacterium]